MRGSRKFCQKGSNIFLFLFLIRGKRIQIALKAGHHRHLNGGSLAGRRWPNIECWFGSFVIFQRIRTSMAKKPYIFVIVQVCVWGGGSDCSTVKPVLSGHLKIDKTKTLMKNGS